MNRSVLRSALLVALLASVAVRTQSIRSRDAIANEFDIGVAITDVIRRSGLELRENPVKPPFVLGSVVYFQRPECSEASLVMPFNLNYEALPFISRVIKPGFNRRFIYLDESWAEQNRTSMFLEWTRHAVLGIFGATRYFPVKTAIVLAEPADCHPSVAIDWRQVWDMNRYRDARSAKRAPSADQTGA